MTRATPPGPPAARILVADDSRAAREWLTDRLTCLGYDVVAVKNGAEAVRKLHEDDSIEVALVDWRMPVLDGVAVCRQVRAMRRLVYLIIVTNPSADRDLLSALESGADDFISKPVDAIALEARVGAAVRTCSLHASLRGAQRLETIGQLASGVAHEIKTPAQFVGDNLDFLEESWPHLAPLLETIVRSAAEPPTGDSGCRETLDRILAATKGIELDYLLEEIPDALRQARQGIETIARIVHAMKQLDHPGASDPVSADLNALVESTALVARNEWKYVATLDLDLDPTLPPVACHPSLIAQALLNVIVNAAHAIASVDPERRSGPGRIGLRTRLEPGSVLIEVEDDGCGLPAEIMPRVFDLHFTTKPSGVGTGQGLAIAKDAIELQHGGEIDCENRVEGGARFRIRLPLSLDDASAARCLQEEPS